MRDLKNRNRLFSIIIAIMMIFTYMPGLAYAAAVDGSEAGKKQTITVASQVAKAEADTDVTDSDELLMGYLEKNMAVRTRSGMLKASNNTRGGKLSGNDSKVYELIKAEIAKIASGESTDATIKIALQDINPNAYRDSYTAEDLGVETIVANGEMTEEAYDAMLKLFSYDFGKIFNALLTDMPYELYWFDKTAGCLHGSPAIEVYSDGAEYTASFSNPYITFYFSAGVAKGYRGEKTGSIEDDEGATIDLYSVVRTDAVSEAINNATQIRDKYAGESDLNKLTGYKDEICALTSYNDTAAEGDKIPYGDPWQLIWVFDDSSSTEVVCEGYSKAFQFLCDSTSFTGNIECDSVTGTMNGGIGEGDHMWNILHMDDNKNYIADITNSDAEMVGQNGELFMCPPVSFSNISNAFTYNCNGSLITYKYDKDTLNTFDEDELVMAETAYSGSSDEPDDPEQGETEATYKPAKSSTCMEQGNIEYWIKDGRYYADEACTRELVKDEVILPLARHTSAVHENEIAATCEAEGHYDKVVYCTVCGEVISKESVTIPAPGHIWNGGEITTPATASIEGVRTYTCAVCNITKTETIPATASNPQTQPAPEPTQPVSTVSDGQSAAWGGSTYVVTSAASKTVAFTKAKNAKTVTVPDAVMVEGERYKVTTIKANAFKGAKIRSVVIGKNVKKIAKNAFKGSGAAKITLKTKALTKASIKGSLKGSKVKTVKVNISKKLNKSYVKKYKKIFTKANAGKKVTVK